MDSINLADKKRAIKRIHKDGHHLKSLSTSSRLLNGYSKSIELSAKYIENSYRQKYV